MEQSDVANLAGVSLRDAGEFILHAIDEGFILLDHEFRIRCINDEALRLDGRPRSAILGLTYWDAWPGSENLPVAKAFRTALRDRSRTTVEQCCRHDGQELWQEARVFPFGEGLAVFYKNITERKLAEQAIRESETKFRNIADAIPQIVWSARPDGFADYFNRQWYNYTGLPENRGEGEAWLNLFHPDDRPALMARWQHSLATGAPYEVEFRIRHHSGQYRWTLGRALPVRNEQGEIVRWMGTSTDIHERVMAEEARRISESEFRTLAENIPQLAWMADRNGDIFWYNNRWFAYTGTTFDEMKGWGWQKVHHPDHVERVVALYRKRIVEEQCMWEDTFPLRGADGQYRWFLSRAMPICDEDGLVLRWLGTNTDVTLQRETEQALQQANRRKDDFLAMLAHELRNPLAPISTAAQLLKLGAHNPDNIRRSSEIIDRQVKYMSDLVNDLMDVSRMTQGLAAIDQDEVSVAQVIHTAVEQSRPLIEARRQALVVDMRDDGGTVLGDSTRLVQVMTNLLNNSAKYTQQGGRVTLSVEMEAEAAQVRIAVSDNGIGIDAALLPHVFELFTQAERTPDRQEGGLGLGLALVKSIVALHHGHVTASSDGPGKGSTFTVTLPALRRDCANAAGLPADAVRPMHILLVDRTEDGDPALPAALQAAGHMVALCPDEACALTQARELHPSAVLIRTDLPGVEGYTLARQLRALHPGEHATYIALNSSGQSHDRIIARGAGFDLQLDQPVALAALKRALPDAFS